MARLINKSVWYMLYTKPRVENIGVINLSNYCLLSQSFLEQDTIIVVLMNGDLM